jgi:predicted metal-dependent peptidase
MSSTSSGWSGADVRQRVVAANYDAMRHPVFSAWAGVIAMGKVEIVEKGMPTACTDGENVAYGEAFMKPLNRKQTRWVVLHENGHKALHHCIRWRTPWAIANQQLMNVAVDFVVNGWIEEADPGHEFTEHPPIPIMLDPKYYGWSVEAVVNDLLRRAKGQPKGGKGKPKGAKGQPGKGEQQSSGGTIAADDLEFSEGEPMQGSMDEHQQGKEGKEPMTGKEEQDLAEKIDRANRQSKILSENLQRSRNGAGGKIDLNKMVETEVKWQDVLREFLQEVCRGDDIPRWTRMNDRLYSGAGIILPTLYDEKIGEVLIAADTSGSMVGFYPLVFGEVARICRMVKPDAVDILWWDTQVANAQRFTNRNYDKIATQLAPAGGGGTEPSVVYNWLKVNKRSPKCIIFISDGYIGPEPTNSAGVPVLWLIINNTGFVSRGGKVVHVRHMGGW